MYVIHTDAQILAICPQIRQAAAAAALLLLLLPVDALKLGRSTLLLQLHATRQELQSSAGQ